MLHGLLVDVDGCVGGNVVVTALIALCRLIRCRRCCCDAWQHWKWWNPIQYLIASASLHDQLLLLKSHPSVLVFMLSSDELPPPDVEEMYHIPPASPPLQRLNV